MQKGATELLKWLGDTGLDRILWTTDLDLTLVEKSPDPLNPPPCPDLALLCQKLDKLMDGRFYIITGRDMPSVDGILAPVRVKASTEYHNMVRLGADAQPIDLNPRPQWELVDAKMNEIAAEWPGMAIRRKPFMRTIYYTNVQELMQNPEARERVKQQLDAILAELTEMTDQPLGNIDGGKVFDMGPGGSDKYDAARYIFDHALESYTGTQPLIPIYFGDSPGDLPGADFVQENGGIFVSVGEDPRITSRADFHLSTPEECRNLIRTMTQGIQLAPPANSNRAQPRRSGPRAS